VVPELLARQRVAVGSLAAAAVAVVALVAATQTTGGAVSVVAALLLAPVAVCATAVIAGRAGSGDRFAVAAAFVYVVLPFLANRFMLPTYRGTFDARALPALVGVQHTPVFALGVAIAVAVAVAPGRIAAAGGLVALAGTAAAWQLAGVGALRPGLHETVWSIALLEWLLAAGVLGLALRSPLRAAAVGGWLGAAILWGAHRGYADGVFWRSLAVAAPAAAVVLSSLALLVPRLRSSARRAPAPHER
jgi:hypothetical protein